MKITPINMAEAIIEPFWDPQLSGLKNWTVDIGTAHGLIVKQSWCFVEFEWSRKPVGCPALRMSRSFDIDCRGYDKLMVSVKGPEHSTLKISVQTDKGEVCFVSPVRPHPEKEYFMDLSGAEKILSIDLQIDSAVDGVSNGWFNWIGLQNSSLLQRYLKHWDRFSEDWDMYLKPEGYQPVFEPTYGIIVDKNEIEALRDRHNAFLLEHRESPFTVLAGDAQKLVPEKMIHDFVNFWTDTRYCRDRDFGHFLLRHGVYAAAAGMLLKDKKLLRLGARYAMSLAMCENWDDGMICCFPGGVFEHRCFVQSLCLHEIGTILDLAGELFTDLGREYLLRRISEEGLGSVNFNVWKHEYIFHNNQLVWFSPGRMMGYAVLKAHMLRVEDYMELAYRDIVESLKLTILPDGGYVEGPTYFGCVGGFAGPAMYYYARMKGLKFRDVVPEAVMKTAAFAEALISTDEEADFIPICDGRPLSEINHLAVMACLLPDSPWVTVYRKVLQRRGGLGDTLLSLKLEEDIPASGPELRNIVSLPVMGVVASHRKLDGETVKLLIMGNKSGAGHTHEDKGSFVLEFAGETFAMDPGTCDYSSPLSLMLKHAQRHNMLLPSGIIERPRPENPLMADIRAEHSGDGTTFHAKVNVVPGWERYYKKWIRQWRSLSPDVLIIEDEYALARGSGVEFYWNTRLDVQVCGSGVRIAGKRGEVDLEVPQDCSVRVDALPLFDGSTQKRIAICREGNEGKLRVEARLRVRQP